jgi:hypothetical protein
MFAFVLMPRYKTGAMGVCHDCLFTFQFQFLKFFVVVKVASTSNLERVVETGVVWMVYALCYAGMHLNVPTIPCVVVFGVCHAMLLQRVSTDSDGLIVSLMPL